MQFSFIATIDPQWELIVVLATAAVAVLVWLLRKYPMRFSIRDLLWLVLVVAMGLGWWMDNQTKHAAIQQATRQRLTLVEAKEIHDKIVRYMFQGSQSWGLDWSALDEPLVEP